MRKARFTEEQITYALKQVESGKPVGEVCWQLGMSERSFYRWKRKYQGIGLAELRRLRRLEDENRKLKKIVADRSLDKPPLTRTNDRRSCASGLRSAVTSCHKLALPVHLATSRTDPRGAGQRGTIRTYPIGVGHRGGESTAIPVL